MSKKLRVGIIGCGGIAFGKHMPALARLPQVEMASFCDIVETKAAKAAKEFGAEGARVYLDYRKLLEDKTLDLVHVCTPNKSHAEITVAALESGKHVMCEKPMSKTSAEAKKMAEAAKRTGKKLTIGYQNRFRADSQYLNQLCRRGDLGEIYFAKAHAIRRRAVPTWGVFLNEEEQGGGPLIDIGTHALDLTLWMMNNYQPLYAVGNTYHKLGKRENAANAWNSWDPKQFTVEDSAFGFISMKNGATIMLESSWALNTLQEGEARTTLCGTEGGADMQDGLRINGEAFGRLHTTLPMLEGVGVAFYEGANDNPGHKETEAWINCLLEEKEPLVRPEEAMLVTEILEAIYQSAASGKPVYF